MNIEYDGKKYRTKYTKDAKCDGCAFLEEEECLAMEDMFPCMDLSGKEVISWIFEEIKE